MAQKSNPGTPATPNTPLTPNTPNTPKSPRSPNKANDDQKGDDQPKERTKKDEKNMTFVDKFHATRNNKYFLRVDPKFMNDPSELINLDDDVPNYADALNLIQNKKMRLYHKKSKEEKLLINKGALPLYGLIHARFLLFPDGLFKMYYKVKRKCFGVCYGHACNEQLLLPVGLSNQPFEERVRLYCVCCNSLYIPQNKTYRDIDGAFFGTSFAHFF
eukprot:356030_1